MSRPVPFIVLMAAVLLPLVLVGCVKHPLIQAFESKNIPATIANATEVEITTNAMIDAPFLIPGKVQIESDGMVTTIKVWPPFDTKLIRRYTDEAHARGETVNIVQQDEGGAK
ncbi:MAG: hypothetical protein HY340_02895 [Candidatus Kerfeldbacteria bacterium]|nr:hypothetical protein [Candidatus Kerfeldbacteria bacterium]